MTTAPRTKLADQLNRAADPTAEVATSHKPRASTNVQTKTADKIEDNPFFQIAVSKEAGLLLPVQKRDAMIKLLSYDVTKTAEENEAMTKAYMAWLDFMEEQSLQSSKSNIASQNAKVFAELKQVIDEFSNGLKSFKDEIAPFTRRLESIYNIRLSGKAIELLEEIIEDRKTIEARKQAFETHNADMAKEARNLQSVTSEITDAQRDIAELSQTFRFGVSWFGIKNAAQREKAKREFDLEQATSSSESLSRTLRTMKEKARTLEAEIASPTGTRFGELAGDKAELQEMLDISNEDHINAHEGLKSRTLGFIETAERRIDSVLGNVTEVNALTSKTAKKNGAMVKTSAIMNEAVKEALTVNQVTLGKYEPPKDETVEDEIAKAEREETRGAILRHIKNVTMADSGTTNLRNSLTRTNDQLGSMLLANEERIRATKQLRTSGISTMASEMAITMTALADASNAEALHMSQTMVDEMSKTVIGIRNKEVMRQAAEMGIRNEQLAALIVATQHADKIARIGIEEQRKGLTELNKNLAGVTNVTADLQETLKASESVYADAARDAADELAGAGPRVPSNDDIPSRRSTGTSGPSFDPFA